MSIKLSVFTSDFYKKMTDEQNERANKIKFFLVLELENSPDGSRVH